MATMLAPSLTELSLKECIKNFRSVTHVGNLEYKKVRSLLLKLDCPEQLREIEKWSPQIVGPDEEIWMQFIKRDAPGWDRKFLSPPKSRLCFEVYEKAVIWSKNQVANDEKILKAKMDEIKMQQSQHTSKQVSGKILPRLPKMDGMQRLSGLMQYDKNNHLQYVVERKPKSKWESKLTFGAGSRMKSLSGGDVIRKARKEAQEWSLVRSRMAVPTHKLQEQASKIRHLPPSARPLPSAKAAVAAAQAVAAAEAEVGAAAEAEAAAAVARKRKRDAEEPPAASKRSRPTDEKRPIKKPKLTVVPTASASSDSATPSPSLSPSPPASASATNLPNSSAILNSADKPVRPPMRAKRPVNIFMPVKRR